MSYARSPSPYLFEHTAVANERTHSQTSIPGGSPFAGQMGTEACRGSTSWVPMSMEGAYVNPQCYVFQPSASFCGTNFASDLLTTANSQAQFGVYTASARPFTPVSHSSETNSSYDGLSEM